MNTNEFKKKPKLPVYALDVNECTDQSCDMSEVKAIALVETPAIETEFHVFSKNEVEPYEFKVNNVEKRELVGPLMIPNKNIFRKNKNTGEEYYVQFSEAAIVNCQKNFKRKQYGHNINLEHDNNIKVQDTFLLSDWIIKNSKNDLSNEYGFKNLPVGTWMGIIYCQSQESFDKFVKSGIVHGFSVEGDFMQSIEPIEYFSSHSKLSEEEELYQFLLSDEFLREINEK